MGPRPRGDGDGLMATQGERGEMAIGRPVEAESITGERRTGGGDVRSRNPTHDPFFCLFVCFISNSLAVGFYDHNNEARMK